MENGEAKDEAVVRQEQDLLFAGVEMANNSAELTAEEREAAIARMYGYDRMPVDIMTFVEDPYYLGGECNGRLFPYWKEVLRKVFPSRISIGCLFLTLSGAIGTGKSTFARICALYMIHRLDCLKDPYRTLGVISGKPLTFVYAHKTGALAEKDLYKPNKDTRAASPYFSHGMYHPDLNYVEVVEGVKSNATIGGDVVFEMLSEINFIPKEVAEFKLNQCVNRVESRFIRHINYFVLIILDSSAFGDDAIVDNFVMNNPFPDNIINIRTSIWNAKKHQNFYGTAGWFKVFCGDSTHSPFILKGTPDEVSDEMDQSRIIDVPEELRGNFEADIKEAIVSLAGVSVKATGKLFDDPDKVTSRFTLPHYSSDVVCVDFYNKTDKLLYRLSRYLKDIPEGTVIFPRYDIGLVSDLTGLAITYLEGYDYFDEEGKRVRMPKYRTPLMVGISRLKGQQTPLYHLEEFILDLRDRFDIGEFTADSFASPQILQDLEREGIKVANLSVDRTEAPYVYYKNMVMHRLWTGCDNERAKTEACNIYWTGKKYDHPAKGSKDIMDAVSGSVYSCFQNLDIAERMSLRKQYERAIEMRSTENVRMNPTDVISDMLFGYI